MNPTITQDIFEYIDDFLGISESRAIRSSIAKQIDIALKDQMIVHIEWKPEHKWDPTLDLRYPRLWRYKAWKESNELWEKQRLVAEERRKATFILHENEKRVKMTLMKEFLMTEKAAEMTAMSLMKNGGQMIKINKFGVEMCKKVEDVT